MKYLAVVKFILTITFMSFFGITHAQNVESSNIVWATSHTTDLTTAKKTEEINKVTVIKDEKIEWQDGEGIVTSFTILSITGSWSDVNSVGKINYQLGNDQYKGNVTIERTSKDTRIIFVLTKGRKPYTIELLVSKNQIKD